MTEQNEKESIKWYDNILMVMVGSVPVLCMSHLSVCLSTALDNTAWGDSFEHTICGLETWGFAHSSQLSTGFETWIFSVYSVINKRTPDSSELLSVL